MVGIACVVNPYGLRGALFPLELFPKITAWGGVYKSYIAEFGDLRELVRRQGPAGAERHLSAYRMLLALGDTAELHHTGGVAGRRGECRPARRSMLAPWVWL